MWTNIFRIGELQVVSWFQFVPYESDPNLLSDKSSKAEQRDATTQLVLSAHLLLQNEGFLSTWTNSFVGPWDPSQGVHNPDEKIKLWLFFPGRQSSISETAQAAVSRLRVVGNGLWIAPGDSEEVALALSQALRNAIERSLRALSYVRFGDVFTRCTSFGPREISFRRVQPTFEFVFAATEEAIYVHAIISAKHIRGLSSDDLERVLKSQSSFSDGTGLPVIVAPNGLRGRLTGCRPSDFIKQVYFSNANAPIGLSAGLPFHVAQSAGCQFRGQNYYAEVTLGCPPISHDEASESDKCKSKNALQLHIEEPHLPSAGSFQQKRGEAEHIPVLEKTLIYPAEAVLVPMMHKAYTRPSLKRFWLQNGGGAALHELWPLWNFPCSSQFEHCESFHGAGNEFSGTHMHRKYNSSSNSNSSSISSMNSTSSESDCTVIAGANVLEADADSLACKQPGLSSNGNFENDGRKMVSKRPRAGVAETFGQIGTILSASTQDARMSEYNVVEVNSSATTGGTNGEITSYLDFDDNDRGIGLDVENLLILFGPFNDFFDDDSLAFGEPPGTAESQALAPQSADSGDASSSPFTGGLEHTDMKLSPVSVPFEGVDQSSATVTDDARNRSADSIKDTRSPVGGNHASTPLTGKFDFVAKAEAMMTFAPEYAAVEIPGGEFSTAVISTYQPRSKNVGSSGLNAYAYSPTPTSLSINVADKYPEMSKRRSETALVGQSSNLYTHVQTGMKSFEKKCIDSEMPSHKEDTQSSPSGMNSSCTAIIAPRKKIEGILESSHFLLSLKTALATEVECLMFQAAMCRIRHTLLSLKSRFPSLSSKLIGSPSSSSSVINTTTNHMMLSKFEDRKKDSVQIRVAGDVDIGMLDGTLSAQVGVWRSVGAPKGMRPSNSRTYESPASLLTNPLNNDGQRHPLQDLLDAMAFLVQQSSSFVDVSLDIDDGDGSYCWLASQEQRRRGFSCGPSMIHAGCGGLLAACHSVDIAGVDLINPLSADVQASSVISLLQSDIKVALKSAFSNLDGPLSVVDWCKGRSQLGDSASIGDGLYLQCLQTETKDSSSTVTLAGEPISPSQSAGDSSCTREGARIEDPSQRRSNQESNSDEQQKHHCRFRPTLSVLPLPAILVGYQDDWLKTSANCMQLWEKAPLEPYALQKSINYYVVCPDIDFLMSAAADFFQQLGTVYESCKLGSHSPHTSGAPVEPPPGKYVHPGFVLVDCPQEVKIASSSLISMSSVNDYFLALSKGWELKKFVESLRRVLKELKLGTSPTVNPKEGGSGSCTVVYVLCPFPESVAVLQTLIESSAALGSNVLSPEKERRAMLHSQVAKALSCTTPTEEASAASILVLSGFSIPKVVLQIVTIESLLRVHRPTNELALLKDVAFTVYNKARRIPRAASTIDMLHSSTASGRSSLMQLSSSMPGLWKDCLASRISGPTLTRDGDLDAGLRQGTWDNSWQTSRIGGLSCDPNRSVDLLCQDDSRYMFEPLFILAEPGFVEHAISPIVFGSSMSEAANSKSVIDDNIGIYMQTSNPGGNSDTGTSSLPENSEHDQRTPSLHCCYGWTEDWRWLICIWTDSRGELLDNSIFPFGGISSHQDTKVLQYLFVQILHQGCQILSSSSPDTGSMKPRDIIITRIGCFFELECQEWHKAIYAFGGSEVKKWPLQLRRSTPDVIGANSSGASLQQQDMGLIQERNIPSSPSPSFYSPHAKSTSFMKGGLGQTNTKKQLLAGSSGPESSRGLLQFVQSITLVGVSIDHSLHLVLPADVSSTGGGTQSGNSLGPSGYLEGFSPVKSLGSTPASYLLIPSPNMRYLPPNTMHLPTCLTSESPPLAHLLHSKGSAIPLSTAYVVSKAVPTARKEPVDSIKEDWPSILAVSLIDHYGGNIAQEKVVRGTSSSNVGKQSRSFGSEAINKEYDMDTHTVLESAAAELHSLSWMTASPVYLERRTALPCHCDMLLRLRRLLHYADKEFSRPPDKAQQS